MHVINFDPAGEYCVSNEDRIAVLEDIQQWRAALSKCNATIETYNKTLKN